MEFRFWILDCIYGCVVTHFHRLAFLQMPVDLSKDNSTPLYPGYLRTLFKS
ncbi:hypothetical protein RintRC_1526 [Richelia intracellularis]|nr:hypothetical protein RintRC_1526 [Richelia intracellularis]